MQVCRANTFITPSHIITRQYITHHHTFITQQYITHSSHIHHTSSHIITHHHTAVYHTFITHHHTLVHHASVHHHTAVHHTSHVSTSHITHPMLQLLLCLPARQPISPPHMLITQHHTSVTSHITHQWPPSRTTPKRHMAHTHYITSHATCPPPRSCHEMCPKWHTRITSPSTRPPPRSCPEMCPQRWRRSRHWWAVDFRLGGGGGTCCGVCYSHKIDQPTLSPGGVPLHSRVQWALGFRVCCRVVGGSW